jgi:hypothetical protein
MVEQSIRYSKQLLRLLPVSAGYFLIFTKSGRNLSHLEGKRPIQSLIVSAKFFLGRGRITIAAQFCAAG